MSHDPFALLGLPRAFNVEPAAVRRAYLELSARAHPDLAGASADSDDRSSAINLARQTLEDPEKRAQALLALLMQDAGISSPPTDDRALPTGFLQEMMRSRQQIEDDVASQDPARLRHWESWGEQRRAAHQAEVSRLFSAYAASRDPQALRAIRLELNAWRYIERMMEQLGESGL